MNDQPRNRRRNGNERWLRRMIAMGVAFAVLTFAAILVVLYVVLSQVR